MSDTYQTSDIGLSAFLRARGHRIVSVDGSPGRGIFTFQNSKQLNTDVLTWANNEPSEYPARDFFNCLRDLKGLAISR
jgi:hypothetical protein